MAGGDLCLNGKGFFFGSTNGYDMPSLQTWNPPAVDNRYNAFSAVGIDAVRMFFFNDGGMTCADPVDGGTIQTSPGVYSESALRALDIVVKKAKDRGIKILATFTNNQNDANGGMCRYLLWAGVISNPSEYNWDLATQYYQNASIKTWVKNYMTMLMNRTNTQTGIPYKNEPTIMAWEIMNEPRGSTWANPAIVRDWLREMAQHIKSVDPKHLVTTGEEGFDNDPPAYDSYITTNYMWAFNGSVGTSYTMNTAIPEIDFASIHNYQYFPGIANDTTAGRHWILGHNNIARRFGKPMFIGEYGLTTNGYGGGLWYYPGANYQPKIDAFSNWWALIESTPGISGDMLWQFVEDGSPWWLAYSPSNIYYTSDTLIWPLFQLHNERMKAKAGP
ncbi:MAG: cellulase family glycosylhydrolase [Pseudomonadota bacterium]